MRDHLKGAVLYFFVSFGFLAVLFWMIYFRLEIYPLGQFVVPAFLISLIFVIPGAQRGYKRSIEETRALNDFHCFNCGAKKKGRFFMPIGDVAELVGPSHEYKCRNCSASIDRFGNKYLRNRSFKYSGDLTVVPKLLGVLICLGFSSFLIWAGYWIVFNQQTTLRLSHMPDTFTGTGAIFIAIVTWMISATFCYIAFRIWKDD